MQRWRSLCYSYRTFSGRHTECACYTRALARPVPPDSVAQSCQYIRGTRVYPCKAPRGPVLSPNAVASTAHAIEHRYIEIGERRLARAANVPARLDLACALPGQQDRQVVVAVRVSVTDAAAVHDHRMIEQ